jgi:hypothetical protein
MRGHGNGPRNRNAGIIAASTGKFLYHIVCSEPWKQIMRGFRKFLTISDISILNRWSVILTPEPRQWTFLPYVINNISKWLFHAKLTLTEKYHHWDLKFQHGQDCQSCWVFVNPNQGSNDPYLSNFHANSFWSGDSYQSSVENLDERNNWVSSSLQIAFIGRKNCGLLWAAVLFAMIIYSWRPDAEP